MRTTFGSPHEKVSLSGGGGIFGAKPKKSCLHFRYPIVLYCAYVLGTYEGCIFCNCRFEEIWEQFHDAGAHPGGGGGKSTNYPGEVFYPEPPFKKKKLAPYPHLATFPNRLNSPKSWP